MHLVQNTYRCRNQLETKHHSIAPFNALFLEGEDKDQTVSNMRSDL